jgi:hypothetical protein
MNRSQVAHFGLGVAGVEWSLIGRVGKGGSGVSIGSKGRLSAPSNIGMLMTDRSTVGPYDGTR